MSYEYQACFRPGCPGVATGSPPPRYCSNLCRALHDAAGRVAKKTHRPRNPDQADRLVEQTTALEAMAEWLNLHRWYALTPAAFPYSQALETDSADGHE